MIFSQYHVYQIHLHKLKENEVTTKIIQDYRSIYICVYVCVYICVCVCVYMCIYIYIIYITINIRVNETSAAKNQYTPIFRAKICNYSNVCFVNYERQASFFIMTVIILFGDNLVFTIQSTVSPFLLSLPNKTDSISNFLTKTKQLRIVKIKIHKC